MDPPPPPPPHLAKQPTREAFEMSTLNCVTESIRYRNIYLSIYLSILVGGYPPVVDQVQGGIEKVGLRYSPPPLSQ